MNSFLFLTLKCFSFSNMWIISDPFLASLICSHVASSIRKQDLTNNHLLPGWWNRVFLLFHLLLIVWIEKLERTPVFTRWMPCVRCHFSSLSPLDKHNAQSVKCDVVETQTLDLWPSHVSVVHMTRLWTHFLPLKDGHWKSKQLRALMLFKL